MVDFGLAKNMHGTDYFRQGKGEGEDEEVPIKWMAPESLEEDIYTEATDVVSLNYTPHGWLASSSTDVPTKNAESAP